jgi:hypothetical protein
MPALAKRSVGSLRGTQGEEATKVWEREEKWEMKVDRILDVGHSSCDDEVVDVMVSVVSLSMPSEEGDDSADDAALVDAARGPMTEKA